MNIAINMLDLASFEFREQLQRYGSNKPKILQSGKQADLRGFLKVKGKKNNFDRDPNKQCKRVSFRKFFAQKLKTSLYVAYFLINAINIL